MKSLLNLIKCGLLTQSINMTSPLIRTEMLLGSLSMEKLAHSTVAIFGLGGVGGYAAEALARSGVGAFHLIDNDIVDISNINRQILATRETLGKSKVEVAKERILSLNPSARVTTFPLFYLPSNSSQFDFTQYDYVIDAIDTITGKIQLVLEAQKSSTPIISAMGCGNRIDPTKLAITDIYKTTMDPLSKVMRKELKKRHVKKLKVLWSSEEPILPDKTPASSIVEGQEDGNIRKKSNPPGSTAFVPPAAGLIIASQVVQDITGFDSSQYTKSYKRDKSK